MRAVPRALVREPLVHFALLGVVLFALDAVTSKGGEPAPPPACSGLGVPQGPIVVDADVRATLARQWAQTHAAPPDPAQLDRLVERFIDEEVLYREGLRSGLAEGDAVVHERIASQMRYVLASRVTTPEPSDDELRASFDADPSKWAQPDRIDFTQVHVAGHDEAAQVRARALLTLLQDGADPGGLGDTFAGGRRFRGRRVVDLAERFGEPFVDHIGEQPEGIWRLRRSGAGLHLVRIDRRMVSEPPTFDAVRDAVRHDWTQRQHDAALQRATGALRERWEIVATP